MRVKKKSRPILPIAALLLAVTVARAGVTVTQNVSPGATGWPGSPVISTLSNPSGTATVGESFNSSNTNLAQTFTVTTTNYVLQTMDLYVGGGTGTGSGTNLNLNLYDLGTQTAPNPSPYAANIIGGNLLGSGAGLPISYSLQANAILKLDFTGADQVVLQNGHEYAFEISGVQGTLPALWYRSGSDTYSGGAAYRNQAWINGSNARDFALAVYGTPTNSLPANAACTVDAGTVFQRIDGFGASSAWRSTWTTTLADMLFSTNASGTASSFDGKTNFNYVGCGLSLLRSRIVYANTTAATDTPGSWETTIMQYAQARGARVWSTPWTPAAGFKSTNDIYDSLPITNPLYGGSFLGSGNNVTNLNYASQLANYVASMKNSYGVNIYALSLQNEPDYGVNTYEACQWAGQQIHDFTTNLYAAFAAKGVGSTKIMLPESENWASNPGLYTPALGDTNSAAQVAIIANHNYVANNGVGDQTAPAAVNTGGKALWETEVALSGPNDSSITNAIYWAGRIHQFMTVAQANAWHYWWLVAGGSSGNSGLIDTNGIPAKRLYAAGQFSRFVRPNFYRINVTNNSGSVQISAYKDPASSSFAIVAINSSSTTVTQIFNFTNAYNITNVTPWMTTSNLNVAVQAPVTVSNASFGYALPALSIVTFVGQGASNSAPVFVPAANQTINPGFVLNLTNTAVDTDQPQQTLAFALLSAPTNAVLTQLNNTNAVFSWRPLVAQGGTTNTVSIQVTDSGTPPLAATNRFTVVVNPPVAPVVSGLALAHGQAFLTATGMAGPDYVLWGSTNLLTWQILATSNAPALPVNLLDTNASNYPMRFYKIQNVP